MVESEEDDEAELLAGGDVASPSKARERQGAFVAPPPPPAVDVKDGEEATPPMLPMSGIDVILTASFPDSPSVSAYFLFG